MKTKKLSRAEKKKLEKDAEKAIRIKAKQKESAFSKNKAGNKIEAKKPGRKKKELNPSPEPEKKTTWVERAALSYSAGFTSANKIAKDNFDYIISGSSQDSISEPPV